MLCNHRSLGLGLFISLFLNALVGVIAVPTSFGQTAPSIPAVTTIPDAWMQKIKWRCIGPANMSGRITAITVFEKDPSIWWAASASGGLVKTINNGMSFEHQFDHQATVSIGDVQVSQVDSNIVWVGTGEANARNSVSWGDGVYKSTDGGKTWTNKGLKKSFQIGRMALHPTDANIVFVGALGRLWGPSEERGLYKTTDGGETWKRVLFVDDKTGVIDVQIDPANPNNVLAATYERLRDGLDSNDPIKKYGPGAGIYRSTDAGETFTRVTQGLPSVNLGRIGLNFFTAKSNFVYAIIESEKIAKIPEDSPTISIRTVDAEVGAKIEQVTKDSVAEKAGLKIGDIVVEVGAVVVHNSEQFWNNVRVHKAGELVRLEISREKKPIEVELELEKADVEDGPNAGRNPFTGVLGGQAANLQEQQGTAGSNFGGVYQSTDGGVTWARINSLNPRPMYYSQIRVDPKDNQNLYVLGTSMHRSKVGGKEFSEGGDRGVHSDHHALWIDPRDPRHMILGNDGGIYVTYDQMETWDHLNHIAIGQFYHVGLDTRRDYMVYGGLQDNGSWGGPARSPSGVGPVNTDWINVGGGDGFVCFVDPSDPNVVYTESQNGGMVRLDTATGQQSGIFPRPQQGTKFRFNWKTPFALSPQNSKIYYSVGNYVFRSVAAGDAMVPISPEITNTSDGSGSALALSPLEYGIIYAGTTDGAVWMSKDDGKNWTAIYSSPQPKKEEPAKENAGPPPGPRPTDVKGIAGIWKGTNSNEQMPAERRKFEFELIVDDTNKITGTYTSPRGTSQLDSGEYDPATGKLKLAGHNERSTFTIEAEIKDSSNMSGMLAMGERMRIEFDAIRPSTASAKTAAEDLVSGFWELTLGPSGKPEEQRKANLKLETRADKSLGGTAEIDGRTIPIAEATFDPTSKKLTLYFGDGEHDYEFSGKLINRRIKASLDVDFGQAVMSANGWRLPADAIGKPIDPTILVGNWEGFIESENIPAPANKLTFSLEADAAKGFQGKLAGAGQTFSIDSGTFEPATNQLTLVVKNDDATFSVAARVIGEIIVGEITIAGGALSFDFSASKAKTVPAAAGGDKPADVAKPEANPDPAESKPAEMKPDQPAAQQPAVAPHLQEPKAESQKSPESKEPVSRFAAEGPEESSDKPAQEPETKPADPIAGKWSGGFVGEMFRGERGRFEMSLDRDAAGKITGSLMSSRGETKITGGTLDEATGKVELAGSSESSTVEISATLAGDKLKGIAKMGGGRFTVDFEANRAGATVASVGPPGEVLEKLLPGPRWVSSLTASRFNVKRVYITLDGHRSDDDTPYLFASEDEGGTWRSLRGNIPLEAGTVHALREDFDNENLLYLGCEFSAWVSIDRGQSWTKISGLPTVAVHDLALHEASHEVVAATHGRSLWIADIDVLKQLSATVLQTPTHLFTPNSVVRWRRSPSRGSSGTRRFIGENPIAGANIFYLNNSDVGQVEFVVRDIEGAKLKTIPGTTERGLQFVNWDFSTDGNRDPGRRGRSRSRIIPGAYLVEMQIDGAVEHRAVLTLLDDPNFASTGLDATYEDSDVIEGK